MKKVSFIFILLMFVTMISLEGSQGSLTKRDEAATIPDNVYKILQNSCFECHTIGGRKKALSVLNFSEWDNYSPEKKAEKASDIVKIIRKGNMPPQLYRQSHPERVPTSEQRESIIKWGESFVEK